MVVRVDHSMSCDRCLRAIPASISEMIICGMRDHFHIDFCDYNHNKYHENGTFSLVTHVTSANTPYIDVSAG